MRVPQQIIQFWDAEDHVPARIQRAMQTWMERPGYSYRRFNDEQARQFLLENFPAAVAQAYGQAAHPVLKAVLFRYAALSVLGGAVGVGIGFGLQKLAANYVSGFVILFERSLRIGDTVRVDNFEGVVADIKTRYTLIRSLSGRESIVPNEKLITERIENLSLADPRILLSTDVTVGYDSDVDLVQRILLDAARTSDRVIADPAPAARLVKFGADGLEFTLQFWIGDPQNGQMNVRSDVNLHILKSLREAGIEIPFPQRVVHLKPGAVTSSATATTG